MSDVPHSGIPGGDGSKSPSYRVMLLDAEENVQALTPIPVLNDEAAKIVAMRMANGLAAELWDGLRFIERFDPNPS
ncbi:hypothetical protein [Methylobacterium brachythecii]|uniref:Uncharacterized protein n=1 Tax=Methylobacterium brachythecii TaxID=1176177 RepID=A0A7W6ALZ5_9HYPH|nr:hypothetical protein [Methylobacterium brachythecii]MBB3903659.1 hypothetical protein [Methylobacterium brachythecii]GLS44230.1 hypothetical protein GCM10007884_22180 [Methylobacterium brachythecii]